jgi:sulfide:quinone oxidoreductase
MSDPFRVLIVGGGVAALEALLALRDLAGDRVAITLCAPDPMFRHRPLSVTEPFGLSPPHTIDLAEVALEGHHSSFLKDALEAVDTDRREVTTAAGRKLEYDALLVALGARGVEAVPGAMTFRDSADGSGFAELLELLDQGGIRRLAFAVPSDATWPLGLYELALLTSAHAHENGLEGVELTLVTPEEGPLAIFGRRATAAVGRLLEQAGIDLRAGTTPTRFEDGRLLASEGESLECDRVVALPVPEVPPIPGLPQQRHRGFIPTGTFCGVLGVEAVFAAGDATWFPVKQGGLAAQQADSAASAIAEMAGAPVAPQPFRPVLRGAVLTEWGPRYLRTSLDEGAVSAAARSALWWPPAKIAGKYLAPFLAARAGHSKQGAMLTDLDAPVTDDPADVQSGHEDAVGLALASANADARWRNFPGALRWLEVAEDLELYLPREYELKRTAWQELAREG